MLKVVYITESLSIHDFKYLKTACEADIKVFLFAMSEDVPEDIRTLSNIEIHHIDLFRKYKAGNVILQNLYFWLVLRELRRYLKEIKPDVVHAGWVFGSGFITALSGFHPFLLMPWGSDVLCYPRENYRIKQMVKYAIKKADMITCDCQRVKNTVIGLTGYSAEKIIVFPWGIDLSIFHPQHTNEAQRIKKSLGWENNKILIMSRSYYPVHGTKYFLQALPEILNQVPEARVLMMGAGPLEGEMKTMARDLAIDDKIRFLKWVPNEELPNYLCAADIYVSTSLSDGTSLCLLEGMACRLPVVVSDAPANLEWIENGKNGHVVPRRDSTVLAWRIIELLGNEVERKRMGALNISMAREKADWNRNFAKLKAMYKSLAELEVRQSHDE
ncbi:glycosyltransferase family 4 protein [Candidatus Margulisiibacteriota bacterium]